MKRTVAFIVAVLIVLSSVTAFAASWDELQRLLARGENRVENVFITREQAVEYEKKIAAGKGITVAINADGSIVAVGDSAAVKEIENWQGITAVRNSLNAMIGLRSDGTFEGYGYQLWGYGSHEDIFMGLDKYELRDVACGGYHTAAVKKDGSWIVSGSGLRTGSGAVGAKNLIKVTASSNGITAGLTAEGEIVISGLWDSVATRFKKAEWTELVDIEFSGLVLVGLKADGSTVITSFSVEDENQYRDALIWTDIVALDVNQNHIIGLKNDGTVVATGENGNGQCDVSGWTDIVAVSAGYNHSIGLKSDGTVVAAGSEGAAACAVADWKLFSDADKQLLTREEAAAYEKKIAAGKGITVAVRQDGGIAAAGNAPAVNEIKGWSGVSSVRNSLNAMMGFRDDGTFMGYGYNLWGYGNHGDIFQGMSGMAVADVACGGYHTAAVMDNGTFRSCGNKIYSSADSAAMKNVTKVTASSNGITAGLKADGSLAVIGLWDNVTKRFNKEEWHDLVDIEFSGLVLVGLKSDGTILITSFSVEDENQYQDAFGWTDIVAMSVNQNLLLGLKSDGTVVACGKNDCGQCDVGGWTDIVAVAAGYTHAVGVKSDGTVVAAGKYDDPACDVAGWKLW